MTTLKLQLFRTALALGIGIGIAAGSAPAHAGPTAGVPVITDGDDKPWSKGVAIADRQAAVALFLEGNKLFDIPLLARAADKYAAALAHWKHPSIYFNLALTQLSLGEDVDARANFELALEYGEGPLGAEWFQTAEQKLAQLEHALGRVHITCPTSGAEVTLDGATLFIGPGSYDGWAKATTHEVSARKPEYLSQARKLTVESGQIQSLDLRLVTLDQVAEHGRRWASWGPWVVFGVGAVVTAGSGVLHLISKSEFDAYDSGFKKACPTGCDPSAVSKSLNDKLSLAKHEQEIAVGGYIVGGAALVTGITLLYLNRARLMEQEVVRSPTASVLVTPDVLPQGLGVSITVFR